MVPEFHAPKLQFLGTKTCETNWLPGGAQGEPKSAKQVQKVMPNGFQMGSIELRGNKMHAHLGPSLRRPTLD